MSSSPARPHGLSRRDLLALDAAKLYYAGATQEQVAKRLFVNRATVSKLLSTARHKGFVRTVITDPRETDTALIHALTQTYGLSDVRLVVPVGRGPTDLALSLGRGAAHLLTGEVRPGDSLGIWWSPETEAAARAVRHHGLTGVTTVSLQGREHCCPPESVLTHVQRQLGYPVTCPPGPLIYPSFEAKVAAEQEPELRGVLAEQRAVRIAVLGVDGPGETGDGDGAAGGEGPVGSLLGRDLTADGSIHDPMRSQLTSGLTLPALRQIETRILVAGGQSQAAITRAALLGRYATHLVTDVETACTLLDT